MRAVWSLLLLACCVLHSNVQAMSTAEKRHTKEKILEMFSHAYNSYMGYAYPADELMPLSCRGRVRGYEKGRGDIDFALGRFSLTLIDTLDTLAVIGSVNEFNSAIRQVIRDTKFDSDVIVSVFETNIRVLGGLLGGHFAAVALKEKGYKQLSWYKDQLLAMAEEVGNRLLPAFNTTTGLPYPKINLRYGMGYENNEKTTCTACAGTMILEFAALSRLTGNPEFEVKAHQAMEAIWRSRNQGHNLVGTVINVHNAEWSRIDSGVGAGIDSYYEYCLKSYILLGDREYLRRFGLHYDAIKRYITSGPLLVDVSMNAPHRMTRSFMDSLLAFWPGLQVLWGDVDTAINIHDMLYHVTERHNFLPEAFTHDFRVHWGNHPLRPEFIESTYYLYKATGDPYYLDVGRTVVNNLDKYARVPCGFAAIKDLRTKTHEDRMDSFVLAETFKYLYLLFAEEGESPLDMNDFVFTTEAHLLPLSLANLNCTLNKAVQEALLVKNTEAETKSPDQPTQSSTPTQPARPAKESVIISAHLTCSNERRPFLLLDQFEKLVFNQCTSSRFNKRPVKPKRKRLTPPRLSIDSLDFNNPEHRRILPELGIVVTPMDGGKVQVSHMMQKAKTPEDAEEGYYLMQDIMKFMGKQEEAIKRGPKLVLIDQPSNLKEQGLKHLFIVGPAMFGPDLGSEAGEVDTVSGEVVEMTAQDGSLDNGCSLYTATQAEMIVNKVLLVHRGGCLFVFKVRHAQKAGAVAVIVADNIQYDESTTPPPFSMSGDGSNDITIPSVFMSNSDAQFLRGLLNSGEPVYVSLSGSKDNQNTVDNQESSGLFDSGEPDGT